MSKEVMTLSDFTDPDKGTKDGHYTSTWEYLQSKALAGDSSDCIPGIEGIGLKTAAKFIRQFGSVEDMWAQCDSGAIKPKGVVMTRLMTQESRDIYHRNITLMDWGRAPELDLSNLSLLRSNPSLSDFRAICEDFGLKNVIHQGTQLLNKLSDKVHWDEKWQQVITSIEASNGVVADAEIEQEEVIPEQRRKFRP